MSRGLLIYCCGCKRETRPRITNGEEIYPHREDLKDIPFWKCDRCKNYVGCHHKTIDRFRPLGNIPTPEIRRARNFIHEILDPIWKEGHMKRRQVYNFMAKKLRIPEFHTGDIRDIEEAREVYLIAKKLSESLNLGQNS